MRESEQRYRLVTQNSLTGIYIHQDAHFTYVNNRLAEIIGYDTSKDMIDHRVLGICPSRWTDSW